MVIILLSYRYMTYKISYCFFQILHLTNRGKRKNNCKSLTLSFPLFYNTYHTNLQNYAT